MSRRTDSGAGLAIEVVEAATNNLKKASCAFPHGQLTVITGVSGSGKSSLAFDTVYAEGQRRYVETLSTYARQFLQQMRKPPAKALRNLQPALALRQHNSINNARSTLASVTELDDHLRLLFAGAGRIACYECGDPVFPWTPAHVVEWLRDNAEGERIIVLGGLRVMEGDDGATLLRQLVADGYRKLYIGDAAVDLDSPEATAVLDATRIEVVLDRIRVDTTKARLSEAIEASFAFGDGRVDLVFVDREPTADGSLPRRLFQSRWVCSTCETPHHEPIPALFNSHAPLGSCPRCDGYGRCVGIAVEKVVPDTSLSIEDEAIAPFRGARYRRNKRALLSACMDAGVPTDRPWNDMDDTERDFVLNGGPDYDGVFGLFTALESRRHKAHVRIFVSRFRGYTHCRDCDGSGLGPAVRAVRVGGSDFGKVMAMRVDQAADWFEDLTLPADVGRAMESLIEQTRDRLHYLRAVGVGYLNLNRTARTLSGGELHRVLLATNLGRRLTDTCYVLDEPTAGLHAEDTERLIGVVEDLRDLGNTVLVVEHDTDVMRRADHLVEIGPLGGDRGGNVEYEGAWAGLVSSDTATGRALSQAFDIPSPKKQKNAGSLVVRNARLNNLRGVEAVFPKQALTCVTGVSGSGKSSLVHDVLYKKLLANRGTQSPGIENVVLEGDDFDEVVLVDQASLPSSSRSCALTLSGAYTPVRTLYAGLAAAREAGLKPGAFSFNTPGGRCERCEGLGYLNIEMHFIADVRIPCDVCDGRRFAGTVLRARYEGLNIADVFDLTIDAGIEHFAAHPAIVRRLEPLQTVGLGYLRLGQATSALSGGEAQRVKLASYIGGSSAGSSASLFIFDEPTVGLHASDVARLRDALQQLVDAGHTVIVVEHNLDFVRSADHVIDLGPGAGPEGGALVVAGSVADVAACEESLTGAHLRRQADSARA